MTLHVERHGAGPDLVLLHGWGLNGGVWCAVAPRLADSHRVHVIDLPGHGASSNERFETLDSATDAIAAVIPRGALVCGWSLGALMALRLATRHPEHVRGLALVSATPCFVRRPGWPHAIESSTLEDFAAGLRDDPQRALGRFMNLIALGAPGGRATIRSLCRALDERGRASREALEAGLKVLRETDLREAATLLDRPAIVIHGRRDKLAPVGAGRWLVRHIPRARFVELEEAAHVPFVSHRETFLDAIEAVDG